MEMNAEGAEPARLGDGSLRAVVAPAAPGPAHELVLFLPPGLVEAGEMLAGRFFLARCGRGTHAERNDWSIYLRRALFITRHRPGESRDEWAFFLSPQGDPGSAWLAGQAPGTPVHLLGPFGQSFSVDDQSRNFLVLADAEDGGRRLRLLLPLLDPLLDHGGRVTLLLRSADAVPGGVVERLPLAVEVHSVGDEAEWATALGKMVRWADQVCVGLPPARYRQLADAIREARFRVEPGFAQVLVQADLLCGWGACLACVVPTAAGGVTRACVHGPVLDLTTLVT